MEYTFEEDEGHSFVIDAEPVYGMDFPGSYTVAGVKINKAQVVLYPQELWIDVTEDWVLSNRGLSNRLLEALIEDNASGKFDE